MRRLSRETIRLNISIALTVLKPFQQRAIGAERSLARDQIVDDLVMRIMGPSDNESVILRPSMVSDRKGDRNGKWGADEPHPHPDTPFADH